MRRNVTVSLDDGFLHWIDEQRGPMPRSRFIEAMMRMPAKTPDPPVERSPEDRDKDRLRDMGMEVPPDLQRLARLGGSPTPGGLRYVTDQTPDESFEERQRREGIVPSRKPVQHRPIIHKRT